MLISPQTPYRTKEEYVYEVLRSSIQDCVLAPGQRLVQDRISEELGVSPIPVRSALQRLQAEGLVEIIPHSGAVVSSISPEMVEEVFLLLETLERSAFSVLVERITPSGLEHIQELVDRMDRMIVDNHLEGWGEANARFHLSAARETGMELLESFTRRTLDQWERIRRCYFQKVGDPRVRTAQQEHRQMLRFLKEKKVEKLLECISNHNRQARDAYIRLLKMESDQQM